MPQLSFGEYLQRISETLQTHSPEHALRQCDGLIKKNPDMQALRALKSLLLLYCGNTAAGVALALTVAKEPLLENDSISLMERVLSECNEHAAICKMYEQAFKQGIGSEDFANHWFYSLLRQDMFSEATSLGLKMALSFNSVKFEIWALGSAWLLVQNLSDNAQRQKYRDLCKRLALKLLTKLDARAITYDLAIFLHEVLIKSSEYNAALNALTSHFSPVIPASELTSLEIQAHLHMGQSDLALAELESSIANTELQDWEHWIFFKSAMKASGKPDAECLDRACTVLGKITGSTNNRNVWLAEIDAHGTWGSNFADLCARVSSFVAMVHEQPSCTFDLWGTLSSMSAENVFLLLKFVIDKPLSGDAQYDTIWASIARAAFCSVPAYSGSDYELYMCRFANDYATSNYPDARLLCCLHSISCDKFEEALLLAKSIIASDDNNFMSKLVLILLYVHLGAVFPAWEIFESLSIRQIQLDTISFLILDHLVNLGAATQCAGLVDSALAFYDDGIFSADQLVVDAFKHERYSSLDDFYQFRHRLRNSAGSISVFIANLRIKLISLSAPQLKAFCHSLNASELLFSQSRLSKLSDNRDFKVLRLCDIAGELQSKFGIQNLRTSNWACYSLLFLLPTALSLDSSNRIMFVSQITGSTSALLKHENSLTAYNPKLLDLLVREVLPQFENDVIDTSALYSCLMCALDELSELNYVNAGFPARPTETIVSLVSAVETLRAVEFILYILHDSAIITAKVFITAGDSVKHAGMKIKSALCHLKTVLKDQSQDSELVSSWYKSISCLESQLGI